MLIYRKIKSNTIKELSYKINSCKQASNYEIKVINIQEIPMAYVAFLEIAKDDEFKIKSYLEEE